MVYNVNGIEISSEKLNEYYSSLINRIFAVLGVYEDCENINDFTTYNIYIDRVLTELAGGFYVLGINTFLCLTNILNGIRNPEKVNHKKVKSLVFHCISIINKIKIPEEGV